MFEFNGWRELAEITTTLTSVGMGMFGWLRKGSEEEDEVYAESAEFLVDAAMDADRVNKIHAITGNDVRDQLSIGELEQIAEEGKLRRWGWGRN